MLLIEIVCLTVGFTTLIVDTRDEIRYEEIRRAFDAELSKQNNKLYQRQRSIQKMANFYKCLKTDYSSLKSRCDQLEAENRELRDVCAKLRRENLILANASYLRNQQILEKENPV